jgi:hypothetical protein
VPKYLAPRSFPVTLDGNGNGNVAISIDNSNVRWIIDNIAVETNQAANTSPIPRCVFRMGDPVSGKFLGGTDSGALDTGSGRAILYAGDVMYAIWSGGVPGSIATATVTGTFDPAGATIDI